MLAIFFFDSFEGLLTSTPAGLAAAALLLLADVSSLLKPDAACFAGSGYTHAHTHMRARALSRTPHTHTARNKRTG
jgi:hypothetical protein